MGEVTLNLRPVTTILIVICLIMFCLELINPSIIKSLSFSKENLLKNPLVLITSALLHADFIHLTYNLFALFFLGSALEGNSDSRFMIILFIGSVTMANFAFLMLFPESSAVGISGLIYGLIGALIVIKPKLKIIMPIGFLGTPMPIIIAGPLLAFGEFILSYSIVDGVAHVAHFGGFIAGFILGLIKRIKK